MKTASVLCSVSLLWLCCFSAPASARCTFDNVQYNRNGEFVSATIYRNQNKIATINRPHGLDAFYVQCPQVDPQRTFTSPNHAAWAACTYCR